MPAEVTLEDIWKLFKETDRRLNERFRETDERFRETDERFRETDERFRETNRQSDLRSREAEDRLARLERTIAETSRHIDGLGGSWGLFVEGMVAPATETIFAARGIPVHLVAKRVHGQRNGMAMEIDLLVTNDSDVVAVEVKSSLRQEDVDAHLDRLAKFKTVFPRYADARVFGAVAGVDVPKQVAKYAYRKGLFVLVQSGETMKILNDDTFRPATF